MKYSLNIIVNTQKDEYDHRVETDSIDETVQRVFDTHPKCSSMVITLVPTLEPVMDESGQSAGFESVSYLPTQIETVGQRLKRIYPEHYVRIITLATDEMGGPAAAEWLSKVKDYGQSLASAFTWYDTTEGYQFWNKLSKREEGK